MFLLFGALGLPLLALWNRCVPSVEEAAQMQPSPSVAAPAGDTGPLACCPHTCSVINIDKDVSAKVLGYLGPHLMIHIIDSQSTKHLNHHLSMSNMNSMSHSSSPGFVMS